MLKSLDGVVDVVRMGPEVPPALVIEVPHGADEFVHYQALRAQLQGDLPANLEDFFFINTDVGAWALGVATAEHVLRQRPDVAVLLLRSLIPRTFIDCNRAARREAGKVTEPSRPMTAGIPSYVRDPADVALLAERHGRYVATAEAAFQAVLGRGGLALTPHTYGPHSMAIAEVGDDIVEQLHRATTPESLRDAPLRAEIDLLTRDGDGFCWASDGLEEELLPAFAAAGYGAVANGTYYLHPATLAHTWSARWPHQVLCLEVRRDLLVDEWTPFAEMHPVRERVDPIAAVIADALARRLPG